MSDWASDEFTETVSVTPPASSVSEFKTTGVSTLTVSSVTFNFLNPVPSTARLYVPGRTSVSVKLPSSFVLTCFWSLVALSVSVIFAPGTTAPAVSLTMPETRELTVCAKAMEVAPPSNKALSRRETSFMRRAELSTLLTPLKIEITGSWKLLIVAPSFFLS